MKNILKILILGIYTSSCSEFLVQEPDEQVSITEQFSSRDRVSQAVNGMYYDMESILSDRYYYYADLQGGNITFTPSPTDFLVEVYAKLNIIEVYEFRDKEELTYFSGFYKDSYEVVNAANLIIENIQGKDFLTDAEKNQITAEALTTRAFMQYLLSLLYAQNYNFTPDASHPGVVYNTRTLMAGIDYPSRETMANTYALIKSDLDRALALYTDKQFLAFGPDYSYFNPLTTQALYAKIALQMNDWVSALEYSDLVISNSGIALMDKEEYISEWEKPEEAVKEVVLEFSAPRTSEGDVSSSVAHSYFSYDSKTSYNAMVASGDLLEMYDSMDVRKGMFVEARLPTAEESIVTEKPYFFTRKFQDDPGTTFIRLSEMYLVRAEAYARQDLELEALSDLNLIRNRAGLADVEAGADVLEEIFLERRRELAFEGSLFFDIARYKKDVRRNLGCLSAVCDLNYPSDFYVLPIPLQSVVLNENMQQNEGY